MGLTRHFIAIEASPKGAIILKMLTQWNSVYRTDLREASFTGSLSGGCNLFVRRRLNEIVNEPSQMINVVSNMTNGQESVQEQAQIERIP